MSMLEQVQDHTQALDRHARGMVADGNANKMAHEGYKGAPALRNEAPTSLHNISNRSNEVQRRSDQSVEKSHAVSPE